MPSEARSFKVGLFVVVGVTIAVAAIIAIGASRFFEATKTYVTYFNESVQGLEQDSVVRYRGVAIGRVSTIRIAPDGRLVETVMKIDSKVKITPDMRVRINIAGITGMRYLEVDRLKPGQLDLTPKIEFNPPYPLIPSNPSDIKELLTGIQSIFDSFKGLDLKGISDRVKVSLDSLNVILEKGKWEHTIANIETTSVHLKKMAEQIDQMVHKEDLQKALSDTTDAIKDIRDMAARLKEDIEKAQIASRIQTSSDKFDRFMDEGTKTVRELGSVISQDRDTLYAVIENLRITTETLNNLARSIKDNPSIIFSEPPPAEH